MNLGRKPQARTWEHAITAAEEDELFTEGAQLYQEHCETLGEASEEATRNLSAVEGDFLVLRNAGGIVAVCEISDEGELEILEEEAWAQSLKDE